MDSVACGRHIFWHHHSHKNATDICYIEHIKWVMLPISLIAKYRVQLFVLIRQENHCSHRSILTPPMHRAITARADTDRLLDFDSSHITACSWYKKYAKATDEEIGFECCLRGLLQWIFRDISANDSIDHTARSTHRCYRPSQERKTHQ